MIRIATYVLILFASISIGNKIDHIIEEYVNIPYHWIYVAILFLVGVFLYKKFKKIFMIFLVIGIVIVVFDFRSMLSLEYWGVSEAEVKSFLRIN